MNFRARNQVGSFDDADETTAVHSPDPALLNKTRFSAFPPPTQESVVTRRPPPPSQRAQLLPLETLRALLSRYTEDAGPAARPLMLKAINDLHAAPEQFPLLLRGELVRTLGQRLDNPTTRALFVQDAQRIMDET